MKNVKFWAISLATVITLHLYFNANKRYNINGTKMWGLTTLEYKEVVKAAKQPWYKADLYRNTQIHYFGSLPEKTIYIFYPLYFIVVSGVILSINKKK
ncbi:hypothetical protein [Haliscomenobacter hydrossis]|uniref:Uncharacterized protein n=1 Tax=Haliscomenobacter hydrossis (strain ATCC 27775 / DSM 1100 / LMG 10767 / O) TaxID=760192 RepID=F4L3V0_HALH1|nr:hypothetical protein [Haliscomenobacter hydrossis]AEE48704.1 hypothetical protein Halhy_0797 [Haliscomenobacter hydrossis DSM 1100]